MSNQAMPPPNWYPDPETPGQLRYWDGTAWTGHVAPSQQADPAVSMQAAEPVTQAQPVVALAPQAQTGPRAWTRGTIIMLVACIVLVLGGATGANELVSWEKNAHERQAQGALNGFLQTSVVGDSSWRNFANQKMLDAVTVGSPIRGDETTAEVLDLKIEYEVSGLTFRSDLPLLPPDLASAELKLFYTFTVGDQKMTSTALQSVWLSRPFYYGDDVPSRAADVKPSAVGPWRVTSLTLPSGSTGAQLASDYFTTDLVVSYDEYADGEICFGALNLLEDIAIAARTTNEIRSYCSIGDEQIAIGENVDFDDLALHFPVVDAFNMSSLPAELVRIDPGHVNNAVAPLSQYLIRGAEGQYVITLALVETTGGDPDWSASNRVVSIQQVEEATS